MVSRGNSTNYSEQENRPLLLTVGEVALLIGVSTRSVWRMTRTGQFPAPVRVRRNTRWRRSDVERWVAAGCPHENNLRT